MLSRWRPLFVAAAFFNFAVAAAALAAPQRMAQHLVVNGPGAVYVIAALGMLIAAFGVGYALVAISPSRNRGVVWAGLAGKVGVALIVTMQFAAEIIPFRYFALGMGDVLFAVLFGLYLWRTKHAV